MSSHPLGHPRPGAQFVDVRQAPISPTDVGLPIDGPARSCRVCGCTEFDACIDRNGVPCHWIEWNLCSRCATTSRSPVRVLIVAALLIVLQLALVLLAALSYAPAPGEIG